MMHPATAPTLPCPARWPATPPTMAPLMHPFASAAAGANAMPRTAVQRISGFMAVLRIAVVATIPGGVDRFREEALGESSAGAPSRRQTGRRQTGSRAVLPG